MPRLYITLFIIAWLPCYSFAANGLAAIDHFAIAVRDVDKSVKFYTDVLGFNIKMKKVRDDKNGVVAASVAYGNKSTAIELVQQLVKDKRLPKLIPGQLPALLPHIGLETDDFDTTMARLQKYHVHIIDGPIVIPHDVKMVTIADPDNYRIDIGQLLE